MHWTMKPMQIRRLSFIVSDRSGLSYSIWTCPGFAVCDSVLTTKIPFKTSVVASTWSDRQIPNYASVCTSWSSISQATILERCLPKKIDHSKRAVFMNVCAIRVNCPAFFVALFVFEMYAAALVGNAARVDEAQDVGGCAQSRTASM